MTLPIIAYGNDILRAECLPAENTPETLDQICNLTDTLATIPTGVGLAAPQVNIAARIFVTKVGGKEEVVINPVIRKRRMSFKFSEGCLSIPGIYEAITRPDLIDVEYYDRNFNKVRKKLKGFESVVFQHEYDHLNGILFIDHLTEAGRESIHERLCEVETGKVQVHYDMIFNTQLIWKENHKA